MESPILSAEARQLLTSFSYLQVGEGDEVAGTNTLVAMGCVLAAAAGPGSGIAYKDGTFASAGVNWLTAGSLSSEISKSCVLEPLARYQTNLLENIRPHIEYRRGVREDGRKHPLKSSEELRALIETDFAARGVENTLRLEGRDLRANVSSFLSQRNWPADSLLEQRPSFYFVGGNPKILSEQLPTAHWNFPLVYIPANNTSDVRMHSTTARGIMDGCVLEGPHPIHLRGLVVTRVPRHELSRMLIDPLDADWPLGMLWLLDDPDPAISGARTLNGPTPLSNMMKRYEEALHKVLVRRLKGGASSTREVSFEYHHVTPLIRHLEALEPLVPGITGALRPLFTTLLFGLLLLSNGGEGRPEGFQVNAGGVLDLVKHLADRMAFAAFRARHSGEATRIRGIADRLRPKLADGPLTPRELTTRCHRLLIDDCRSALALLQNEGAAAEVAGKWVLTSSSTVVTIPPGGSELSLLGQPKELEARAVSTER